MPPSTRTDSIPIAQIMSLFMIEVIISADGRVPIGQKNLTIPDKA
jgi:hypothetical protein